MGLVKNRRATGEYLEAPQIMEEIEGIRENLTSELKEKKALMKKDAEEAPEVIDDRSDEEEEVSDPVKSVLTHMLIGEKPELPLKKDVEGEKVDKLNEKLMAFKKIAQRKAGV